MRLLPFTLAWARLRKYSLRSLSVAVVVALVIISFLALQGISVSTTNSLVRYSLAKLSPGDRTLTITSNRIVSSPAEYQSISDYLSRKLSSRISGQLTREILYHEISDSHGVGFYFGGVNDLKKATTLLSGRYPNTCTLERCEVLQFRGDGILAPRPDSIGLVIVGKAKFSNNKLFTGTMSPTSGVSILVADGISAVSSLNSLANREGTDAWVGDLNFTSLEKHGPTVFIDSLLVFENQLSLDQPGLVLTWPQDAINEASTQSDDLKVKFITLNFVMGGLFIAFLILFSLRAKIEHRKFREGLSRIGTPRRTLTQELVVEYSAPLLLGFLIAGLSSPLVPLLLLVAHFDAHVSDIYRGSTPIIFLIAAGFTLMTGTAIAGDRAFGRWVVTPFLLTIPLLCIYFWLFGNIDQRTWAIPFFYGFLPVTITYLVLRWSSKIWRERKKISYLFIREYLPMWQGVASILTLTTILAVTALAYESGITRDINSQAENQVPLDISITTGSTLVRPLELGGLADYEKLQSNSRAFSVLRMGSSIRSENAVSDSLSLIGIPPAAIAHMPNRSIQNLSSVIAPDKSAQEIGIAMGSTSQIRVELAHIPKEVDLIAWFRTPQGTHLSSTFIGHGNIRSLSLAGNTPRNSTLIAFEFQETSDYLSRRLHATGEGSFSVPMLKGSGSILKVSFDGHPEKFPENVWGFKDFPYAFNGGSLYVKPTLDLGIPSAIVDPTTAKLAANGLLTLTGAGNNYFQVRVRAVREYFPSAGNQFVIMDLGELQTEISRYDLGATDPIEIWISSRQPDLYQARLKSSIFQVLQIQSRSDLRRELQSDPKNVGLNGSYKVALLLALLIAIYMYVTALPLMYREGKNLFFQLEAGGVGPRILRKSLRLTLRLTTFLGISIGTVIGLAISEFSVSKSFPMMAIALMILIAIIISEVFGFIFTRKLFRELTMVEA
jgi:hypothetical protein